MTMRISDSNKTYKTVHPSAQLTAVDAVEERQSSELEELAMDPEADNGDSFEF